MMILQALAVILLSSVGPKSNTSCDFQHFYLWSLGGRSEGSSWPMTAGREENLSNASRTTSSKHHGTGHVAPLGALYDPLIKKRGLRRAHHRAQCHGWTTYKGRVLTSQELPHQEGPKAKHEGLWTPPPPPRRGREGRRTSIFSWNVGGLTAGEYHEVCTWLAEQQIGIALLQGIQWKDERTWTAYGFHIIQSGEEPSKKPSFAGVITLISQSLCKAEDIAFATAVPGRLLHVKCQLGSSSIDVVNLYQHPDAVMKSRPRPQEARGLVWSSLDQLLHSLASRNILLLGGDFNCAIQGHGRRPLWPTADESDLQELVRKYHLSTVRTHDPNPTYIGHGSNSTIDFVFMRQQQMDALSREGHSLTLIPLASWKDAEDHLPIVCSIPLGWKCWIAPKHLANHRLSKPVQEQLYKAWQQQTPTWHQVGEHLEAHLWNQPQKLSEVQTFAKHAIEHCNTILKCPATQSSQPHRSTIAEMWHRYGQLRRTWQTDLKSMFRAWTHYAHIRSLKKALDRSCRQAKRNRLLQAAAEAHQAAQRHDGLPSDSSTHSKGSISCHQTQRTRRYSPVSGPRMLTTGSTLQRSFFH